METLFRFQPRPGGTIDASLDWKTPLSSIRIGRSPDSELRLQRSGLRYRHAVLQVDGAGLTVTAESGGSLGPVAQPISRARLEKPGDQVRAGPDVLTLTAPDPALGADRVVVVTLDEEVPFNETARAAQHLAQFSVALPNIRLMATGLSLLVFICFFVLPLVFAPIKAEKAWTTSAGRVAAESVGENAPQRLAALWEVGTISKAHSAFATNCAACHESGFVRVRSSACLDCHRTIGQHADPHLAPSADLSMQRCETCHHEHKGMLIETHDDQHDCVSCHGDLHSVAPGTHLADVRDFGRHHPQFSPSLVQDAALHTVRRFELDDPKAEDHGNLRFTHARHLQLYKVAAPGNVGGAVCGQCHVAAPGGLVFKPVSFEASCASCHKLQFEPKHPEWRLPHGHREEILSRVEGFYAQAALAGETFAAPSSALFEKPGTLPAPVAVTPAAVVSAQTAATMVASIANSACGECHATAPPGPSEAPTEWKVLPVWQPDHYLTKARFSHDKHLTMQCLDCHAASASNGGVMTMLPGIETCRSCHSGEAGAEQRVASGCITCHAFHDASRPLVTQVTAVSEQHTKLSSSASSAETP